MHVVSQLVHSLALAQADAGPQGGFMTSLIESNVVPVLLMVGAMYFIMIRPMLKQNRQHQDLLKQLKKDDEVVTSGGIYGKIFSIDNHLVVLEIASGVRIKVLRTNISGKWNPQAAPANAPAVAKE